MPVEVMPQPEEAAINAVTHSVAVEEEGVNEALPRGEWASLRPTSLRVRFPNIDTMFAM